MRRARLAPDVVDNHVVACRAQVERHAGTHGSEANETHSHRYLLATWIQNFAANMGIALPAHREKESMPMDLRNSLYQLTQPLLTHRSLPHQSINQ
jgi:hypothetical protein